MWSVLVATGFPDRAANIFARQYSTNKTLLTGRMSSK